MPQFKHNSVPPTAELLRLTTHPEVKRVMAREIPAKEARSDVPHFEVIVTWKDDIPQPKSYFTWPSLEESLESASRAADNREEIRDELQRFREDP